MAKKTSKSSPSQDDANVVRIRATSAPSSKSDEESAAATTVVKAQKTVKAEKTATASASKRTKKIKTEGGKRKAPRALGATGGYFKGAWVELRQVRWPNRRATWSLTGAVIAYSAFFVVFVLLLDAAFKYLFQLILKQ